MGAHKGTYNSDSHLHSTTRIPSSDPTGLHPRPTGGPISEGSYLSAWGCSRHILCPNRQGGELFETFRYQYPESKQYTWSARGAASRLDRFYISKELKENLIKTEITSCTISDHDFCILYLDLKKVQDTNGPGYWKCNNSILDEKEFLQDFNLLIHQLEQYSEKDLVWWEHFKISAKDLIIKHSKLKSAKIKNHINNLENQLRKLKQHPIQNSEDILSINKELDIYISHQAEGNRIRAKIENIEENENPSKYFKILEKHGQKKKEINYLSYYRK